MIYDCFSFFNELDLLEIRLNYLNDVVDKFVLVEMGKTHSFKDKPFFFEENKERFKKFLPKIIHIKVTNYPRKRKKYENSFPWVLENYQRDCILRGLTDAKDDDIIVISDADEIPSKDAILNYSGGISVCIQNMMYYYLNNINISCPKWACGTRILSYSEMKSLKNEKYLFGAVYSKKGYPTHVRFCSGNTVQNGGWHFSYLGTGDEISYKIKSFAHQELNEKAYTDINEIEKKIKHGKDLFDREYQFSPIPLDDTFPDYILKHKKKYCHLILPC